MTQGSFHVNDVDTALRDVTVTLGYPGKNDQRDHLINVKAYNEDGTELSLKSHGHDVHWDRQNDGEILYGYVMDGNTRKDVIKIELDHQGGKDSGHYKYTVTLLGALDHTDKRGED